MPNPTADSPRAAQKADDRPPVSPADTFTRGEPAREGEHVFMRLPRDTRDTLMQLVGTICTASMLSACLADGVRLLEVERTAGVFPKQMTAETLAFVRRNSDRFTAASHLAELLAEAEVITGTIHV